MKTEWIETLDKLVSAAQAKVERRTGELARYPMHQTAAQAWTDPHAPTIPIELIDVSINGVGFGSEYQFKTGQYITISFTQTLPNERPQRFEVMWSAIIHGQFRHGAMMI